MFDKEAVEKILAQARCMDPQFDIFGVSKNQYRLGPPVDKAFVLAIEEQYHFRLPKDYVQFITEVGDGGAGPGYGLYSFGYYRTKAKHAREVRLRETYLQGLAKKLQLLPLKLDEVDDFCVSEEEYIKNPEKYFREGKGSYNWDNNTPYGFFVLGTYGCRKDFGLVLTGERYGQVFSINVEGGYELEADSFQAFYQGWLDFLSDTKRFQEELNLWRRIRNR